MDCRTVNTLFGDFTYSNITRNFHYSCVTEITCLSGTAIGQGHQNSTKNRWGGAYFWNQCMRTKQSVFSDMEGIQNRSPEIQVDRLALQPHDVCDWQCMEVSRARKLAQADELGDKVFRTVLDSPQQARAR